MIASDTSSLVAFWGGNNGKDVEAVEECLRLKQIVIPPVVLTEILSAPNLPSEIKKTFGNLEILEITNGYWVRVGELRHSIIKMKRKANLADSMIAQSCIDYHVPLITRDSDFSIFTRFGLKLFPNA